MDKEKLLNLSYFVPQKDDYGWEGGKKCFPPSLESQVFLATVYSGSRPPHWHVARGLGVRDTTPPLNHPIRARRGDVGGLRLVES